MGCIMEYQKTQDEMLKLINFMRNNNKALTVKAICKDSNVDQKIVELFLNTIEKFDYIKVNKSPSGRFINYEFNPFSKNVYFSDNYSCIIEKGVVTQGRYGSVRQYSQDWSFKHDFDRLPDLAKNDNCILVLYKLEPKQLCEEVLKFNKIVNEVDSVEEVEPLKDYPFVKERVALLEKEKQRLETEVQDEINKNDENLKWFETETIRAQKGERYKIVSRRGKYLGKETIYGMPRKYKDSAWNGGNTYYDTPTEEVDKYEMIDEKVPDYPKKIEPVFTKQVENESKIDAISRNISELQTYPIKWNKIFAEEKQKNDQIVELEKQKAEINNKINSLMKTKRF